MIFVSTPAETYEHGEFNIDLIISSALVPDIESPHQRDRVDSDFLKDNETMLKTPYNN